MRAPASAAVVAALLGGLACAPPPAVVLPTVADSSMGVYEVRHLKVIQRYHRASDVVAVRLYLLGGTRQLTEENAGAEVLLLRAAELDAEPTVTRTGSQPIFEVTPDWTVIGFVGLLPDVDSAWSEFARQLQRPRPSQRSLERARGELLTLARRRYTQPDLRIRSGAQRNAFHGHPYALDPEGTVASLTSLTAADLERYWTTQFVTSRMLLVVVGAVTRAKVESLVTATFAQFPAGQYRWTLPPPVPRKPSSWLIEHQKLSTNYIVGYFDGPLPTDHDYLAFRVLVEFLSSDLASRIREQRSLSYAAHATFLDRARPVGAIYVSTSAPGDAVELIREALLDYMELYSPVRQPFGWFRFVDQMALEELTHRLTSDGQAETLARTYLYFGDPRIADEFTARLRRVQLPSLGTAARRYLQDIQFAYMGDTTLMSGKWN